MMIPSRTFELRWLPLLVFLVSACTALAESTHEIERRLDREYLKKDWIIRNFYSGDELQFDSSGKLVKGGKPESWTLAGIQVTKIKIRGGELEISGRRFAYVYAPKLQQFQRHVRPDVDRVKITSPLPSSLDESNTRETVNRILASEARDLVALMPEYWHDFLMHRLTAKNAAPGAVVASLGTGEPVYRSGNGVEPPRPSSTPDPQYVEAARRARFQGTVELSAVVDKDGRTKDIQVVTPVGWGLDDQAAETVSHWRFLPATRVGKPVAVRLGVQVSFRLY